MKVGYATEVYTDDFQIDFSKKEKCKGILKLEVLVLDTSIPLLVKDGTGMRITPGGTPFVVVSNYPIVKGIINFRFSEYKALREENKPNKKKAIVRYLYCEQ